MATEAILGRGGAIRLGVGAVGSKVYTTLKGCRDFDFPDASVEEVDVTSHDSDNGTVETIPGVVDLGNFEFSMDYTPGSDSDDVLMEIKASRETVRIGIKAPGAGATEEFFDGWLSSYKRSVPVKGEMRAQVRFRITGTAATAGIA